MCWIFFTNFSHLLNQTVLDKVKYNNFYKTVTPTK